MFLSNASLFIAAISVPALGMAADVAPPLPPLPPGDGNATVIARPGGDAGPVIIFRANGQGTPGGVPDGAGPKIIGGAQLPGEPGARGLSSLRARLTHREKGAYLGVSADPASPVLRKQLDLPEGMGLVVDYVMPDSPAASAGLKEYDVLQKLDDQLLVNPEQLAALVRMHNPGEEIKLAVIRQGKPLTVTAKLIEHELEPLAEGFRLPEQISEQMRQMLPEPGMPQILPGNGPMQMRMFDGAGGSASSFTLVDGEHSYTVKTDRAGHKTFTVKDKEGKSIFDGLIDTPEQRDKLPQDLKAKLEHMEQMTPHVEKHVEIKEAAPGDKPAK